MDARVTDARRRRLLAQLGLGTVLGLSAAWLLLIAWQPHASAGGTYGLVKTYPNPVPNLGDDFGQAVAWSGDQVVVGAPGDRAGLVDQAGVVYLLDRQTGGIQHTLKKTSPITSDQFGSVAAASGDYVAVGVPGDDHGGTQGDYGAVLVFTGTSGALAQTITNPVPATFDHFGSSVAIYSDTLVVGVPEYNDPPFPDAGRVYLCSVASGTCPTVITSPKPSTLNNFGLAVAVDANWVAAGAPILKEAVYIFTATTGALARTITDTTPTDGDDFGRALAFVGGNLLVGAPNEDNGASNAGVAYLYSPAGVLLQTYVNPEPSADDNFGAALAGAGNFVLIGAPGDNNGAGAAYLFDTATGLLVDTFRKPSPAAGEAFGRVVAVTGERFLVGAPKVSVSSVTAGAAYLFGVPPPTTPTPTATEVSGDIYVPLIHR